MKASEAKKLTEQAFTEEQNENREHYSSVQFYEFVKLQVARAARMKEYSVNIGFDQFQPRCRAVDTGLLTQALNEKFEGFNVSIYAKGFCLQWS